MIQGAMETRGPLWGWDANGEEDWDGAVLALLALAVAAATALALHWFGSRQDQDVSRTESMAPRVQPAQMGATGQSLQAQSQCSGLEGQGTRQGKPDSPRRGQGAPAPAGAPHQGSSRGECLALLPKTSSQVASRGTMGQQCDTTPRAPQGYESQPPKPDGDLLSTSKAGGTPAPLLIHFTPRSPTCEVELQMDAGSRGVRGRGRSGRRRRGDAGLRNGRSRSSKPDPLHLGAAAASVWDAVDAAATSLGPEEGWPWVNPGRGPGPRGARVSEQTGIETPGDTCVGERTRSLKNQNNKQEAQGSCPGHPTAVPTPSNPSPCRVIQESSKATKQGPAPAPSLAAASALAPGVALAATPDLDPAGTPSLPHFPSLEPAAAAAASTPGTASSPAPAASLTPAPVPAPTPASPATPASRPAAAPASPLVPASASTITSGPELVPTPVTERGSEPLSWEPKVGISKGYQEGQILTSWGNLIAMVLRSHPLPRPESPRGSAPRAAPINHSDPTTSAYSKARSSGSHPEGAVPSLQDRHHSPLETVSQGGTGGLAEAGCQPQPVSFRTNGAPTTDPSPGPGGDGSKQKPMDLPAPAAPPAVQGQSDPKPSTLARQDSQPVPRPRKRSMCEVVQSSEVVVSQAAFGQHQGPGPGEGAGLVGSRGILTEKQKEAQKLMAFLQKPGSWGVVEGPRNLRSQALESPTAIALWPQRLDLDSCLEVLAFAQQHGELDLAQETYALMSSNLLRVLGDAQLYRQLSGAERERILSLRTGQGRAVLGILVLPSLYQMSRAGLLRGSQGEEAPVTQTVPAPAHTHLHVFDPRENVWRALTRVPEEAPLRGCGLCTMYNYLFLAGGIRGSGAKAICSNEVFCYNPLTNIWSQVRPMQQARAQLKLVAVDGLLYAIGGECLYSMECYDPRTDTWTSRAPLPAGTFPVAHEAVACRGDIYVTGGHLFYRLLRYSPGKDSWDERPYSASHRRSSDMVALGGFLYRFDLLRGVGAAVMRYNTVTGSWSRAASLPLPSPAPLRCAVLGNTIYCLNHEVMATFTVSEGTAQFQAKELQPFPLEGKGVLHPFTLTLPSEAWLQTSL